MWSRGGVDRLLEMSWANAGCHRQYDVWTGPAAHMHARAVSEGSVRRAPTCDAYAYSIGRATAVGAAGLVTKLAWTDAAEVFRFRCCLPRTQPAPSLLTPAQT